MKVSLQAVLIAFAAGIGATLAVQQFIGSAGPAPAALELPRAGEPGKPAPSTPPIGKAPETAGEVSVLETTGRKKENEASATGNPAARKRTKEAKKQWREQIRSRFAEKNRVRLDYLAEELGLTPEQMEQLEAAAGANLDGFLESMNGRGDFFSMARGGDTGDPMETALTDVLTPEQQQAYGSLKEKERSHKIESRTMQRFAGLPETLNLSEDQKDQVFEVFAAEEATRLDNQSKAGGNAVTMMTMMSGGILSETIAADLGEAVTVAFDGAAEGEVKPQDAMAMMRERMEARNAERIEALRPVLNERQLEAYRSHLSNTKGIFGGARVEKKIDTPKKEAAAP